MKKFVFADFLLPESPYPGHQLIVHKISKGPDDPLAFRGAFSDCLRHIGKTNWKLERRNALLAFNYSN